MVAASRVGVAWAVGPWLAAATTATGRRRAAGLVAGAAAASARYARSSRQPRQPGRLPGLWRLAAGHAAWPYHRPWAHGRQPHASASRASGPGRRAWWLVLPWPRRAAQALRLWWLAWPAGPPALAGRLPRGVGLGRSAACAASGSGMVGPRVAGRPPRRPPPATSRRGRPLPGLYGLSGAARPARAGGLAWPWLAASQARTPVAARLPQ